MNADKSDVEDDSRQPLAALGRRSCAWLVDAGLGAGAAYIFARWAGGARDLSALIHLVAFKSVTGPTGHDLSMAFHPGSGGLHALRPIIGLLCIVAVIAVIGAAYRIVSTALWGGGIGKHLLGLRIVVDGDRTRDDVPGWGRSWRRWVVPQAPGLIPLPATGLIAFLPAFRDARRRGLHDRAAGTVVVDVRTPQPPEPTPARGTLAPLDGYFTAPRSQPSDV